MADQIGQEVEQDGRTVSAGEGHQVPISAGVCSDHASKAPGDCCREAVRKAAQEDRKEDS